MPEHDNPFTRQLDHTRAEVDGIVETLHRDARGMPPFDQEALSPEEEAFVFANPAALFPDEVDPETGVAITNAQAAARLLQDMGATKYTAWVDKHYQRSLRGGG